MAGADAGEGTEQMSKQAPDRVLEQVLQAMAAVGKRGGNAASLHRLGQAVRRDVDVAAAAIAHRVGMPGAQVCFVSCVAHAHALAILALLEAAPELVVPPAVAQLRGRRKKMPPAPAALLAAPAVAVLPRQDGPWALAAAMLQAHGHVWTLSREAMEAAGQAPSSHAAWIGYEAASVGPATHLDVTALCAARPGRALLWPAAATPVSVALGATALGGPPGIAALVAKTVPTRAGTVPRELVVGFGVAAAAGLQKLA